MNKSIISGRLTRDPILNKEKETALFQIANNIVNGKKIDKANYVSCIAYKNQFKIVKENLHKGDLILIDGFLLSGSKEKNNITIYTTTLVVKNIEFLSTKNNGDNINNHVDVPDLSEILKDFPDPF